MTSANQAVVVAVSRDPGHRFSKPVTEQIQLRAGWGVEGDAHAGVHVQHRFDQAADPTRPNLRQVHLIHSELLTELRQRGFPVAPGQLGENITTAGIDLLALPRGTQLHIGNTAVIEVTGLRNPCHQINDFHPGLLKAVLGRDPDGRLIRKAGVMATITTSGPVQPGDALTVHLPTGPHHALDRV